MLVLKNRVPKFLVLGLMSMTVLLGACTKKFDAQPEPPEGNLKVKVVNSVIDSDPQDFYQNDSKISTSPVSFGQISSYLTVRSGAKYLNFRNSGTATVKASILTNLPVDSYFTVFYAKDINGDGVIVGGGDDKTTVTGKAKIRFIHLNSFLTNNITVKPDGGSAIVDNLQYTRVYNYVTADPAVALNVTYSGSNSPIVIPAGTLTAGKNYTIWFSGTSINNPDYHIIVQE